MNVGKEADVTNRCTTYRGFGRVLAAGKGSLHTLHGAGSGIHSGPHLNDGFCGKDSMRACRLSWPGKEPKDAGKEDDLKEADPEPSRGFHIFILEEILSGVNGKFCPLFWSSARQTWPDPVPTLGHVPTKYPVATRISRKNNIPSGY